MIRFSDLACRRGDRILWNGLSGAVEHGAALRVIGPNGSGKSSLLRILAGLLPPYAGVVTRDTAIGLADEAPALDRDRTLGQALGFWARVDRKSDSDIAEALAVVDMAALAEVPVRYLSTGQRRRAGLARLLVQAPPLWLLDEPTNGLDTASLSRVESAIATHRAQGGAVIVATHLDLALPDATLLDLTGKAALVEFEF